MNTKLTLRMDDRLIESAKHYSANSGKSVSRMVADYFTMIQNEKLDHPLNDELTPTVRALKGILADTGIDKAAYLQHLEEKHL